MSLPVASADLLAEWSLVVIPLLVLGMAAAALFRTGAAGRGPEPWARQLARLPNALERITGIPGWAAAVVALGLYAPVLSVVGFYTDVAWHIQFGRDKTLWTPPHVMIVFGLVLTVGSAAAGIVFATVTGARTGFRWGRWQVPWSILPLGVFSLAAFIGFLLDDLWHASYGVDVTLWSPPHLLLVGASALATIPLWMILREAGVTRRETPLSPRAGGRFWPVAIYWSLAGVTLVRLSTFQAEFDLGAPQFQHLFHPVVITLAAAGGLVGARIALGPGGAIVMAAGFLVLRAAIGLLVGPGLGFVVPRFPLYLASALAVEAAAAWLGTERRGRFALAAGAGVATAGLAGEWWWSQVWGRHPWPSPLLPEALVVSALGAAGAAVLGAVAGAAAAGQLVRLPAAAIAGAGAAVVVALVIPSPRTAGDLAGTLSLDRRGDQAIVTVELDQPEAAAAANWFEAFSWQGGGAVSAPMRPDGDGRYTSARPVPVAGDWKTVLRLHRGTILAALPVYLPADPEIDAGAIPARDGRRPFLPDTELLLRETKAGPPTVRTLVYGVIAIFGAFSFWLLAVAARHLRGGPRQDRRPVTAGQPVSAR
jgi:hypothetical protein